MLEIRHIAGLVCKTLDLALTPKTIKSGFMKPGIVPFDPDVFTEADFIQAVERNAVEYATEADLNEDEQRRIAVVVGPDVGREEEVSSSEPSTSRATSVSRTSNLDNSSRASSTSRLSLLDEMVRCKELRQRSHQIAVANRCKPLC